tara:strand:+ start:155 stop:571 length:417 start_codon:yes stop_codon:yes gene_type:complete
MIIDVKVDQSLLAQYHEIMTKLTLFLLAALCCTANASTYKWQLQITDPDFELIYSDLDGNSRKAYLNKTSWRCSTGPTEVTNGIELKSLLCNYSIEKTGTVKTLVSCSKAKPYGETSLKLYDQRKDLTFTVMLLCRKK